MSLGYPIEVLCFGVERSKVTGSQSAKHVEGDRVAGVSLHSIECP